MNTIFIDLNSNQYEARLLSYIKYLLEGSKIGFNHLIIFLPDSEIKNLFELLKLISLISKDKDITILGALGKEVQTKTEKVVRDNKEGKVYLKYEDKTKF